MKRWTTWFKGVRSLTKVLNLLRLRRVAFIDLARTSVLIVMCDINDVDDDNRKRLNLDDERDNQERFARQQITNCTISDNVVKNSSRRQDINDNYGLSGETEGIDFATAAEDQHHALNEFRNEVEISAGESLELGDKDTDNEGENNFNGLEAMEDNGKYQNVVLMEMVETFIEYT